MLWDDNDITIDGEVRLSDATDQLARFKAAGWAVKAIDGHDEGQIRRALPWATRQDKPTLIACKTKIGKGAATMEGSHKTHGAALGDAEVAATRLGLGWEHEPVRTARRRREGLAQPSGAGARKTAQGLGSAAWPPIRRRPISSAP